MDITTLLSAHFPYPEKQQILANILPPAFVTKIVNKNNTNLRLENKNQEEISNLNNPKFPKWCQEEFIFFSLKVHTVSAAHE